MADTHKRALPFGYWPSSISADVIANSVRIDDVAWCFVDEGTSETAREILVWLEYRGREGILTAHDPPRGSPRMISGAHNVKARVGYGGGAMTTRGPWIVFSEAEGGLYRQHVLTGSGKRITPDFGNFASPSISPDEKWIAFVHNEGHHDCLGIVDREGVYWPQKLTSDADFYMQPAWHPTGNYLAWVEWDHPYMPWQQSRVMLGTVASSLKGLPSLDEIEFISGTRSEQDSQKHSSSRACSVFQPSFSPDGRWLAFISDESGWGNLYLYDLHRRTTTQLTHLESELGMPAWIQGLRTFDWSPDSTTITVVENRRGQFRLLQIDCANRAIAEISSLNGFTHVAMPSVSPRNNSIACLASSGATPSRLIVVTPEQNTIIRHTVSDLDTSMCAMPEAVSFTVENESVHALLYRPQDLDRYLVETLDEKPPAIVMVHGGPTSQAVATFNAKVQYFVTRGYVVLEVNYRGSSGYGRAYQEALNEQWGILDVVDLVAARAFLVEHEIADPRRIVLMGGSAGGYSVLKTLANYPRLFTAGICLYGISNLLNLALETHKFEMHYLDHLIGPLPQTRERYRDRSPLFLADRIVDPLAIFQGTDDIAVPQAQSDLLVTSLEERGIPHVYHLYEGEGHGWSKPETIRRHYEDLDHFLKNYVLFR